MKALVTAPFPKNELSRLKKRAEVVYKCWKVTGKFMSTGKLIKVIGDKEILIVELQEVGEEVFRRCTNLKIMGCCRGNPLNVDLDAATKYGVPVIYTPARNAVAVAELTIAMMINIARNVGQSYLNLKKGKWNINNKDPFIYYKGRELNKKNVGLIGFGAVGVETAKRLRPFNTNILVYDPYVSEDFVKKYGAQKTSLEKLLKNSHFVSIHAKVTRETKSMFGKEEFKLMNKNAFLINTSRAILIEKTALINALKNKQISGAALDVFYEEPVNPDDEILKLDNVLITPHIGGATFEIEERHAHIILNGLFKLLSGKLPENIANPEVFKSNHLRKIRYE